MRRARAFGVGVVALATLCVPEACQEFAPLAGSPDAAPPGDATSMPTEAAFDAHVPPFHPSFANDAGPGDILATVMPDCPVPSSRGGAISGEFGLASLCVSTNAFVAPITPYCAGVRVISEHVYARANGSLRDNGDHTATRTGYRWLAAELEVPCRTAGGASGCAGIASAVSYALGSKGTQVRITCYDESPTTCDCQLESDGSISDSDPEAVDAATGTLGSSYAYGYDGPKLWYTGTKSSTLEPAFFWTLIR